MLYCQSCGAEARSSFKFCPVCGHGGFGPSRPGKAVPPVAGAPQSHSIRGVTPQPAASVPRIHIDVSSMQYAGFWRRAASLLLDSVFVSLLTIPVAIAGVALADVIGSGVAVALMYAISIGIVWLYYAMQESGPNQATWGKRIMGLVVSDMQGQRLSFGRAAGRHLGRFFSILLLYLGYVLALFTERRQTLHDKLAGTVVLYRGA